MKHDAQMTLVTMVSLTMDLLFVYDLGVEDTGQRAKQICLYIISSFQVRMEQQVCEPDQTSAIYTLFLRWQSESGEKHFPHHIRHRF